jgi:murein DD-endopeptidase MepM/ murein hydrolase activator NlpD
MADSCPRCHKRVPPHAQIVLVRGKTVEVYCSDRCVRANVSERLRAARAIRIRWLASAAFVVLALGAGRYAWQHRRLSPRPSAPTPVRAEPAPAEPSPFGPHWPPTDDDWMEQFTAAHWLHPLPGPTRRRPLPDERTFAIEKAVEPAARCRTAKRCSVDLGGELWGEHVYAALDGVVDRVQRVSDEAHGGISVRISHWGGVVFTHYFHLAAVPRRLTRGMHVNAGDIIGLVGATGIRGSSPHLCFALSVRPSSGYPEVFWDPGLLMGTWSLRAPPNGTVAGLVSPVATAPPPIRR